ncbi:calcium-binding protein [Ruminococcus sp. XPD3002]|uniref:calcium-binding protein n=1 Tax=Ruminococcus sp. XPD3002 TaxID=1452269 RepID=UPI000918F767|nr:Hemolysin-type calcium-binding repeat-containing protein [Ruminococcus flavefaciens]
MKKRFFNCLTAAVMLSTSVLPANAADIVDTEKQETQAPTVAERVADGLAVYKRELAHCENVKQVSVDDTVALWNDYIKTFNEQYRNALDKNEPLKKLLFSYLESPYHPTGPAAYPFEMPEGNFYKGVYDVVVSADYISEESRKKVEGIMPADKFAEMTKDEGCYHLYFIDGSIGVIRNNQHTGDRFIDNAQLVTDLFQLQGSTSIDLNLDAPINEETREKLTSDLFETLFLTNAKNHELAYMDYELSSGGFWNGSDEEVYIPHSAAPAKVQTEETADEDTNSGYAQFKDVVSGLLDDMPWLIYDRGIGNDTYHVMDQKEPVFGIVSEQPGGYPGAADTLSLDYDVNPDDLEFIRLDGDLLLNDPVHEVYIMLKGEFSDPGKRIEYIKYGDTTMDYEALCCQTNLFVGTEKQDTLTGYPETNYMWGKGDNDTITGNDATNYMLGYDGDDTITLTDACFGLLHETGGDNYVYGMDGNDTIRLSSGNDFIWGGKGDDVIKSGSGDDIIYYELGDGNDIIDDTNGKGFYPASGNDVLWLGEGIEPKDVHVSLADGHYEFVLTITKTGETISMPGNMYSGTSPVFPIEEIHFADGTTWNRVSMLEQSCFLYGTDGDDELTFRADDDALFRKDYIANATIYGYDGNDTLIGGKGNDSIYGGKGDDTIRGGNGDDTIYYELGDGNDLIDMGNGRFTNPQSGYNVLVLGEGILPDEVTVELSSDKYSYTLHINKTGESVTMTGNVISGFSNLFPIKEIRFADGTVWTIDNLSANTTTTKSTTAATQTTTTNATTATTKVTTANATTATTKVTTAKTTAATVETTTTTTSTTSTTHPTATTTKTVAPAIKLDKTTMSVYCGDKSEIQVLNYNGSITWVSSDTTVAKVTKGDGMSAFIEGISAGDATIYAMLSNGKKLVCQVTVTEKEPTGDVNDDGDVTIADAVSLQNYLLGKTTTMPNWRNADLYKNNRIDAFDMILMRKLLVEKNNI